MSGAIETATEHQPRARRALEAALGSPAHAYLFCGPRGSGKRAAARAFAAELLAAAATADGDDARRRALLDPSPHPDLVWLAPTGAQHMVDLVRERVIRAASYRPFEGGRRVFVVEAAEAMRDESQNALLKTLEEPPPFAHLVLLTAEPEALLPTISSRCQRIDFSPLPADAVESALDGDTLEVAAAARVSAGDLRRARFLLSPRGRKLRATAWSMTQAGGKPWRALLKSAEEIGGEAEGAVREELEREREEGVKRTAREIGDEAKRVGRRRRTELLDFGLSLSAYWLRDLAAVAVGADDAVLNRDRLDALRDAADGLDPAAPRRGVELVLDARRALELNVSEELALEALHFRLERELHG